jgi:hypothetical protein
MNWGPFFSRYYFRHAAFGAVKVYEALPQSPHLAFSIQSDTRLKITLLHVQHHVV